MSYIMSRISAYEVDEYQNSELNLKRSWCRCRKIKLKIWSNHLTCFGVQPNDFVDWIIVGRFNCRHLNWRWSFAGVPKTQLTVVTTTYGNKKLDHYEKIRLMTSQLKMILCLEKKSKNTFGFLRPMAEIDFPFLSWGVLESWSFFGLEWCYAWN